MADAARLLARQMHRQTRRILAPRPTLTVSEWARKYFVLSREASAEPGTFNPDRNPPMKEIMDAMGDPEVETVAVEAAAQTGKTTGLLALLGWMMHYQPGPALLMLPSLELAKAFALDRLAPMIRDCPALRALVPEVRTRDSQTTILARRYPGGALYLTGANSAASLSSRPVRWVLVDETDRAPLSIAGEGSPIDLSWKRSQAFPNRKRILTSSPTVKGASVIHDYFERGDQRRYHVRCFACHTLQGLNWETIRWEKDGNGQHVPESVAWACPGCGVLTPDRQKNALIAGGEWVATHPGRRVRSYNLTALSSFALRWEEIVRDWLDAKKQRATLQVFANTVLAEPFDPDPEHVLEDGALAARVERYVAEVPAGVGMLTAGIDTQDNRLAVSVWGFGAKEEAYLIFHDELMGSPGEDAVWRDLDALLAKRWTHEAGGEIHITAAAIDTGGHHTAAAYRFCSPRQGRSVARLFALKGHPVPGAPLLSRGSGANRVGVRLWSYGNIAVKDLFYARLNVLEAGPGYVHLPDTVDREYLQQLLGERPAAQFRSGRNHRVYKKVRVRTEALDCALYAYLALHALGLPTVNSLASLVEQRVAARVPAVVLDTEEVEEPVRPLSAPPRRRGTGFISGWRRP